MNRIWTNEPRKKTCERCGHQFDCGSGAPGGCWCEGLPSLTTLPEDVTECLCQECLKAEITRGNMNAVEGLGKLEFGKGQRFRS
jgi:hypothetical protein